jgi:tetraacyldisaccharide 4'-kinase
MLLVPPLRTLLWFASLFYWIVTSVRNQLYASGFLKVQRASIPVISVGNITAGGTGKTPVVAYLARQFRNRGVRVAIISRGYGATDGAVNDEALELERSLPDVPHVQNRDRAAAVQLAEEELAAQVILLDDAMQHRRMHRDLEIVLLDATNPFGFGHLLPRGLLRESLVGLRRANIFLLTRSDLVAPPVVRSIVGAITKYVPAAEVIECVHQPSCFLRWPTTQMNLEDWKGKRVLAFCGIGNPTAFWATLTNAGLSVLDCLEFEDHCSYQRSDIDTLQAWITERRKDVDAVVCTAKDIVKLQVGALGGVPLLSLQIELRVVNGKEKLDRCIEGIVDQLPQDTFWE